MMRAEPKPKAQLGSIAVRGVSKDYGATRVLDQVSVTVQPGTFVTLLGPSGCGKTTLLRLIAGFIEPDGGSIALDGRDMEGMPTQKRPVGMVFQNLALFPHMSVAENVAYGLTVRKVPPGEIAARLQRFLDLVELGGFDARRISQLSGGQKQRVALARALILEPSIVLLDEPLSALDMQLRKQLQLALKEIQKALGTTFVFVTHDQEEATSMSDQIVVMSGGKVQQIGSPREIYAAPDTLFVAKFIGEINEIPGKLESLSEAGALIETPLGRVMLPSEALRGGAGRAGEAVVLCLRPERLQPAAGQGGAGLRFAARVADLQDLGPLRRLVVERAGLRLRALSMTGAGSATPGMAGLDLAGPVVGAAIEMLAPAADLQVFPAATGR